VFFGLGLGPGDEVIAPSYTFHATVTPLLLMGVRVVLCDSEAETGNIDVTKVESLITKNTKAIVVTHFWGHPVEMNGLLDVSRRHQIPIIEDTSQALGATYHGQLVGTFGKAAAFSLGGAKMVTGGMGGALVTDEKAIFECALLLGHSHERSTKEINTALRGYSDTGFGENYRISPVAAILCSDQVRSLDARIAKKGQSFRHLSVLLKKYDLFRPPIEREGCTRGSWYGYKAFHDGSTKRLLTTEQLIFALQLEGVSISKPKTAPLHLLPLFRGDPQLPAGFPALMVAPSQIHCPVASSLFEAVVGFSDQDFHDYNPDLLQQYEIAFEKVVTNETRLSNWFQRRYR
jgi:perosamine synthetase